MCGTCGCEGDGAVVHGADGSHTHVLADGTVVTHSHHDDGHAHGHEVASESPQHETSLRGHRGHAVEHLEAKILGKNDRDAEKNRGWFAGRGVFALNIMSSPGSGKTTLLERSLTELDVPVSVLEGDQETSNDADRIRKTGAPAAQINTGVGCHLEASMVYEGLMALDPGPGSMVVIENVGNLVCPALFDLGEHARVVLFSVTEGEDKPLKYPQMFRAADLVLLTKCDLLPYLDFDETQARAAVSEVNPDAKIIGVSAKTGAGMGDFYGWLESARNAAKGV